MKTFFLDIMIALFLLLCINEIKGQEGLEEEKLIYLMSIKDRQNALVTVRYIRNVDYADIYDRSLLMHASVNGFSRVCRILIRKGADPNLQAIDGVTAAPAPSARTLLSPCCSCRAVFLEGRSR